MGCQDDISSRSQPILASNGQTNAAPSGARGRKVHIVKCVSPFFEEVYAERKPFEVRKDDRDYQTDDIIVLRHWEPGPWGYERKRTSLIFRIGFVLRDYPAIRKGNCVFALLEATDHELALADAARAEAGAV